MNRGKVAKTYSKEYMVKGFKKHFYALKNPSQSIYSNRQYNPESCPTESDSGLFQKWREEYGIFGSGSF
jgi:hypothetical protein